MAAHGAKRTRPAEEEDDEAPHEDLDSFLDQDLWPSLREHCASLLRGRVEAELARARQAVEAEFAERWASLQAEKAAVQAALSLTAEARKSLEAEREALRLEKRRMAVGKSMDDIIHLNIGGEKKVSVLRRTLCLVEDSMLASSFSGRWDDSLARDLDGAVFVDFQPELFLPLLDFLRARRIQDDQSTPVLMPTVRGREESFFAMLKYYGLENVGRSPPAPLPFSFVQPLEGRTFELREGNRVAIRSTGSHWKRIFGSAVVSRAAMMAPVTISFCVGTVGGDASIGSAGPNLGVAVSTLERSSDDSNVRKPNGVWAYRAADGALLAAQEADVVGPSPREPAAAGDIITLTLYRDGTMGLAKNKEDLGIVFCNLPASLKPVVEMNLRYTQVSIVP